MSRSQLELKQELHYTSEKSKERGYQYGRCKVYRDAPGRAVFEVCEDLPKRDFSQIRSMEIGKHENILRLTTTDDIKYLNFESRVDMATWFDHIKGLMETCEMTNVVFEDDIEGGSAPRRRSYQPKRQAPREDKRMGPISSPAALDDIFKKAMHVKDLKPASPDDDSPCYENSHFSPQLLEQREAYFNKHELTKLQEDNYQRLIHSQHIDAPVVGQEVETIEEDDDDYENVGDISPNLPNPLTSKQGGPDHPSGLASRRALLPPKTKKAYGHAQAEHSHRMPGRGPNPQNDTKSMVPVKEISPLGRMASLLNTHQPNRGPASRISKGSIISGPGSLLSHESVTSRPGSLHSHESVTSRPGSLHSHESVTSRPGSLHSHENSRHTREQDHLSSDPSRPSPVSDQKWTEWRQPTDMYTPPHRPTGDEKANSKMNGKDRPPKPPPKPTKPTAQVTALPPAMDDIYDEVTIEYPIGSIGLESEAKCVARDIPKRGGSVSRLEEKMNVRIPSEEYNVGDVRLANKDGAVVIERTNLSTYLEIGDQLLQIGDIDVEHLGKAFANICLNSVSADQINLMILRRYH